MSIQELVISGVGLPSASIRGVTQSLEPIGSSLARTVNGALLDLTPPQFKKFRSVIACSDQVPFGLNASWIGTVVTVDCVALLSYRTAVGSPIRPVVSSYQDGDHTFYYPRLTMMIVGFSLNRDEWDAIVSWSINLEEV